MHPALCDSFATSWPLYTPYCLPPLLTVNMRAQINSCTFCSTVDVCPGLVPNPRLMGVALDSNSSVTSQLGIICPPKKDFWHEDGDRWKIQSITKVMTIHPEEDMTGLWNYSSTRVPNVLHTPRFESTTSSCIYLHPRSDKTCSIPEFPQLVWNLTSLIYWSTACVVFFFQLQLAAQTWTVPMSFANLLPTSQSGSENVFIP